MTVGVLLALTGPGETALVQALDGPGTGVRVVRRCADVPELLAAAGAGLGTLAVVSAELHGVDRAVVARLSGAGVRTVLVADPADVERCRALGAEHMMATGPVPELADLVASLAAAPGAGSGPRRADPAARPAGPADGAPPADTAAATPTDDPTVDDDGPGPARSEPGRVVAVWGPPGAPGRTTLAVTLAAELAALGGPVLLADADTQAPSVTQVLGLLDDSSAVVGVARQASSGRLTADVMRRACPAVDGSLAVMTGLTRADRWRELPGAALDAVWDTAREVYPWTVIDTGAGLDDDAGDAMFGPRRHQATASALAAADVVVVVGAGEPVGIRRLVTALSELADSGMVRPGARRIVAVNRVRASAAGPSPERSIHEALARFADVHDALIVPDDRPGLDRAVLEARTLTAAAPASPARLAVESLARELAGERPRRVRRRRMLLARAR